MLKIVADDKIPYLKGVLEPYAKVTYLPGGDITHEAVKDADALITRTRTRCDASLLEGTSVKFIATATIGFDHIDREYCKKAGIQWTNAPGCNANSVHQYIASVLMHIAAKHHRNITQQTLGIVGVGNVGSKIASLGKTLGMQVLLNDPPRARKELNPEFVSFAKIKQSSDIITFHVPLNKEGKDKTYHIADTEFFNSVSPQTLVINSSRGAVVDNQALKQALDEQKIAGAVLDVWENEPAIDRDLLDAVDIGTPHIAGYSRDGKANGTAMAIHAVSKFFNLGLDRWYPEIEQPSNPVIEIDATAKSYHRIFEEAILATYNVADDAKRLRNNPETFEKQRGDYPVRREFTAYTIKLSNGDNFIENLLKKAGFTVETTNNTL